MQSVWDISKYKTNDIVTSKNISELLSLQQQIWNNEKYYFDTKEAERFVKFTRKLTPDKGKKAEAKVMRISVSELHRHSVC